MTELCTEGWSYSWPHSYLVTLGVPSVNRFQMWAMLPPKFNVTHNAMCLLLRSTLEGISLHIPDRSKNVHRLGSELQNPANEVQSGEREGKLGLELTMKMGNGTSMH